MPVYPCLVGFSIYGRTYLTMAHLAHMLLVFELERRGLDVINWMGMIMIICYISKGLFLLDLMIVMYPVCSLLLD